MAEHTYEPGENAGTGKDRPLITVVIPVYMGRAFLPDLCSRLISALETITSNFSIVLVDDRSADNPWSIIEELGKTDRRIQGLRLSRNFGQHHAITAGIDYADADWYVVMDCDLQDRPEEVPLLFARAQQGYDIVVGTKKRKAHGFFKRFLATLFYKLFNLVAGIDLDKSVGNFRIFSDRVASGFRDMREQLRCLPASMSYMGFEIASVEVRHEMRLSGKSSYSMSKLLSLASDVILAHSHVPLKAAAYLGLTMAMISVLIAGYIGVLHVTGRIAVPGWAGITVAVFIVGGTQIFITGVVGIYVGKCFSEAQRRPLYFVSATSNIQDRSR